MTDDQTLTSLLHEIAKKKITFPSDKAKELGATEFRCGINWNWAGGFQTKEKAEEFVKWLVEHSFDHRGVYNPVQGQSTYSVRYR